MKTTLAAICLVSVLGTVGFILQFNKAVASAKEERSFVAKEDVLPPDTTFIAPDHPLLFCAQPGGSCDVLKTTKVARIVKGPMQQHEVMRAEGVRVFALCAHGMRYVLLTQQNYEAKLIPVMSTTGRPMIQMRCQAEVVP